MVHNGLDGDATTLKSRPRVKDRQPEPAGDFRLPANTIVVSADDHLAVTEDNFMPFRKTIGELVFGGVLDRRPLLRIMFAEGGINWMPSALQDLEMVAASYYRIVDWKLQHHPRHYWKTNSARRSWMMRWGFP